MEIAGREVRTVRRMVQYIPLEFFQKRSGDRPLTFGHPACAQFSVPLFFCHTSRNCGLRHFGNDGMQLSYRHASICANFSFSFLKKVVRDQSWPTAPLFVVNISPSENSRHHFGTFSRFTTLPEAATICLQISAGHSLLRWEILWRKAPRIWRDFGLALPFQTRLRQTKPVLPLSNEHGSQVKGQGRRQCCHISKKISVSAYTWCTFTFRTRLAYNEFQKNLPWPTIKGEPPDYMASHNRRHLLNHIITIPNSPSDFHVGFVVYTAMNLTRNIPCPVTLFM